MRRLPRPTYANVMSTLCFVLLLSGGVAFAASKFAKNSVGTKQIKNGAITTAKIKNGAVTGAKIKASTLGQVPNAAHAGSADTANLANGVAAPEPFHEVGAPGEPTFQNGCFNLKSISGGDPTVAFFKDREGIVHLKGIYACGAAFKVAFQLPAGYRPASGTYLTFPTGTTSTDIAGTGYGPEGSGLVEGAVACGKEICQLDGITFRAES